MTATFFTHEFDDIDGDGDKLFGTAAQLAAISKNDNPATPEIDGIENDGSFERTWNAIEHGIAEYEFRDGAAVIFVLLP